MALPALAVVLAMLLSAGHVVMARVNCVDAARAGARAAARSEPEVRIRAMVSARYPAADPARVDRSGDLIQVEVSARVHLPLAVPPVTVRCMAVSAPEEP